MRPRDGSRRRTGLRIAMTVDPVIPVPPSLYGGWERLVDLLVRGLAQRGHDVTLFAHPESSVDATLVPYGVLPHEGPGPRAQELWQVGSVLWRRRRDFDLVQSFGRLAALVPILPVRSLPKVQTYGRDRVPWRSVKIATMLAGDSLRFTGVSTSVYDERARHGPHAGRWDTIFNGVDLEMYRFVATVPDNAPLAFLGRLERFKGPHHAIAIAKAADRRLIIAGNQVRSGRDAGYFDEEIAPHLDGDQITYIGPVNDAQKNDLLGQSAALLMPIEWREAFGIVMAEALACGTPVIGFAWGAVPEVVRDGVNGFVVRDVVGAAAAVARLPQLDRAMVRADCEARFSAPVIVDQYERLYRSLAS